MLCPPSDPSFFVEEAMLRATVASDCSLDFLLLFSDSTLLALSPSICSCKGPAGGESIADVEDVSFSLGLSPGFPLILEVVVGFLSFPTDSSRDTDGGETKGVVATSARGGILRLLREDM